MSDESRADLTHDLLLPTLLFAALGGMSWAVRGCSGFGAMNGCIFAGVLWGTAWWFIAREPSGQQSRPYASGWIILAVTLGIGISGARGWMQWPSFFEGHLLTDAPHGKFVPISRVYGFIWLFIAGVPWAGLGACLLAWCRSDRRAQLPHWAIRIACGLGAAYLARVLFDSFPSVFLPLYETMKLQYADTHANPNLRRLIGDNRAAITHLGLYLGFLVFEIGRRDWRSVTLILTVGLLNGLGWALCQNWRWAAGVWPNASFNFWRCWESSGGISIGIAYGVAYYRANRKWGPDQQAAAAASLVNRSPNLERLGAYLGLLLGLGLSIRNGMKGWANIYLGNENYWNHLLWVTIGPILLVGLVGLLVWIRARPLPSGFQGDVFPHAYGLLWLVVLTQNAIAQLITGPLTEWNEMAFNIYYVLLFCITAVIFHHFRCLKAWRASPQPSTS